MTSIKTIVFDIGMVLVNFSWQKHLYSFGFSEQANAAVAAAMFLHNDWDEYDRGSLTDEELLNSFIKNAPEFSEEISAVFANLEPTIQPFSYTRDWIRGLKARGYRVLFLSNFAEKTLREARGKMDFYKEMDGGIFSFQEKVVKPEREIYEKFQERYQIIPEETVFIDDKKENLEAAKEFGWNTVLFTVKDEVDEELKKIGVEW